MAHHTIRCTDEDCKIIYRHYATLYFVIVVDSSESELAVLDLIHVFVESLDKAFEQVCELDVRRVCVCLRPCACIVVLASLRIDGCALFVQMIFNPDRTFFILDELIQGGMVLETRLEAILEAVADQNKVGILLCVGVLSPQLSGQIGGANFSLLFVPGQLRRLKRTRTH